MKENLYINKKKKKVYLKWIKFAGSSCHANKKLYYFSGQTVLKQKKIKSNQRTDQNANIWK